MFPPGLTEAILSVHLQRVDPDITVHTIHDGHRHHLLTTDGDGRRAIYTYAGRWHITDSHSTSIAPGLLDTLRALGATYDAEPWLAITALLREDAQIIRSVIIPLRWLDSLTPDDLPYGEGIRKMGDRGVLITYSTRTWKYLKANPEIMTFDYVLEQ